MQTAAWHEARSCLSSGWSKNDSYSIVLQDFRRLQEKNRLPDSAQPLYLQRGRSSDVKRSESRRHGGCIAESARRLFPPPLCVKRPEQLILDRVHAPTKAIGAEAEDAEVIDAVNTPFFDNAFESEPKLIEVLVATPLLERLRLGDHTWLSSDCFECLGCMAPPRLRELCLRNTQVTDSAIAAICAGCGELRLLDVSQCNELTNLEPIAMLTEIRELNVAHCSQAVTPLFLKAMSALQSLEVLDLSFSPLINDASLKELSNGCHRLLNVKFACCPNIGDTGLLALATANPQIEQLTLAMNGKGIATDEGVARVVRCLKRARCLDFSGCPQLCRLTPLTVARNCEYVEDLNFARCSLGDEEMRLVLMKCSRLKRLDVSGCEALTEDAVSLGLLQVLDLRRLTLNLVPNVPDERLDELRERLPKCVVERYAKKLAEPDDITYILGPKKTVEVPKGRTRPGKNRGKIKPGRRAK